MNEWVSDTSTFSWLSVGLPCPTLCGGFVLSYYTKDQPQIGEGFLRKGMFESHKTNNLKSNQADGLCSA